MGLLNARMILHADFSIGSVDDRIFGSALHSASPHVAGLLDPSHPLADESGFRTDVIDLVRALNLPCVHSPGRAAGAGPRRHRLMDDLSDLDGLSNWCRRGGAEAIRAIPLSDDCHEVASALVEYCNGEAGGSYADLRRRRGATAPLGLRTWSLEGLPGEDTARVFAHATVAAEAMRALDQRLTLMLSLPDGCETLPETAGQLERCVGVIDYVTLRTSEWSEDAESDLLISERLNGSIDDIARTIDRARAGSRARRPVHVAVEGWSAAASSRRDGERPAGLPTLRAGLSINTVLRRVDRVRFACASDLLSVLQPLLPGTAGERPRATPLLYASIYGRGMSLMPAVDSPMLPISGGGDIPCLDVSSVTSRDRSTLTLFIVNRHPDTACMASLALRGFGPLVVNDTAVIREGDADGRTGNDRVVLHHASGRGSDPVVVLEPQSFTVVRLVRAAS